MLHANNNAFSRDGVPAPTLFAVNQTSTRRLFVQCPAEERPVRLFLRAVEGPEERDGAPAQDQDDTDLSKFSAINLDKVPARSLIRKVEYVLTMFRTS